MYNDIKMIGGFTNGVHDMKQWSKNADGGIRRVSGAGCGSVRAGGDGCLGVQPEAWGPMAEGKHGIAAA